MVLMPEGIVRHVLNPRIMPGLYDPKQVRQAGIRTDHTADHVQKLLVTNPALPTSQYAEEQVRQLIAFLRPH